MATWPAVCVVFYCGILVWPRVSSAQTPQALRPIVSIQTAAFSSCYLIVVILIDFELSWVIPRSHLTFSHSPLVRPSAEEQPVL